MAHALPVCVQFGIGCEREHTLEEIGQEFDVTRERIHAIWGEQAGGRLLSYKAD